MSEWCRKLPVLQGSLLTLRPLREQDWAELFAVASDPQVWALHPEPLRYQEPVFRRFFDGALACGSAFAILDNETGRIIGSSRYSSRDCDSGEIEIGWTFLARPYWGGAYNRELKKLMLEHAFQFVDIVILGGGEQSPLAPCDGENRRRAARGISGAPVEPASKPARDL